MGPSLNSVDIVDKCEDLVRVGIVVLERDLDCQALHPPGNGDRRVMKHRLILAQMFDKGNDASLIVKLLSPVRAVIVNFDQDSSVQEGQLPQALGQQFIGELNLLENRVVGPKACPRPSILTTPDLIERGNHFPFPIFLTPQEPFTVNLNDQVVGERVDHRGSNAVQPSGNLVVAVVELSSSVEARHDHFQSRNPFVLMESHRNATSVVVDRHTVVVIQVHANLSAVAHQCLVHTVVHNLKDQVVQGRCILPTDVHAWTEPDGLKPLQDGDV